MNKNIINLSKIFIKDVLTRFEFFNFEKRKFNKKSLFFWLCIIVIFALSFLTMKAMDFFNKINQPEIFLNIFLLIASFISIFQIILISSNNLYFANDQDFLLPFPIKPKEILSAKLIAIIINMYISELIFFLFPMIIYGGSTSGNFAYYIYLIAIFFIFPIMPILLISIILSFFMKLSKFVKNKNIFQLLITLMFIFILFFAEYKILGNLITKNSNEMSTEIVKEFILNINDKIKNVNKYMLQINDFSTILKNREFKDILYIFKIVSIDIVLYIVFILLGNRYYIKDVLRNNNFIKSKKLKNKNIKFSKLQNKKVAYLKKEIKMLVKNPTFFIQCIFPILTLSVSIMILTFSVAPQIRMFLEWDKIKGSIHINFDIKVVVIILGLTQMILSTSNIAITGISREGKNWIFMKNFPIKLYDQFNIKAYLQVIIVNIILVAIIIFIGRMFPEINVINLALIFILLTILNIINSKVMLLIDLINPNVTWDAEYEINKNNRNKIFQYAFSICMIVFMAYISRVLESINLYYSYIFFGIIFVLILFIINFIVKLNIEKLFNKIKSEK